ncbi:hypothetical protein RRG08_012715 [Elysia crispata]|uniref:Cadherin domain-containing protein n=1 Tax=Elysia crispata TaxID=231223 RepID=A0AAE1DMV4_9GAST|nr:hypothetical protein RRG08_012715 [Elysia crispata]
MKKAAMDELKLASALDYEDTSLRRPLVLFTVEDGGCTSSTFTYTVSVTNVNEAPVIGPEDNVLDVYEGDIQLDPEWTTTDPDFGDDLTYSITASTPTAANFDIDPRSGIISSIVEYDVDQGAMTATVTLTIECRSVGPACSQTCQTAYSTVSKNTPSMSSASRARCYRATLGPA